MTDWSIMHAVFAEHYPAIPPESCYWREIPNWARAVVLHREALPDWTVPMRELSPNVWMAVTDVPQENRYHVFVYRGPAPWWYEVNP